MTDEHAGVQVAAVHAGAGDDQIAHAGQTRKGLGTAAHGHAQAAELGVAAGDEGGLGVVAVAQAHGNAHRQGNDVFDGAAQLGAQAVGVGVDAEVLVVEDLLHRLGVLFLRGCRHDQGGQVTGHFLGMGGTGQSHHTAGLALPCAAQFILDDLGHGHEGLFLHALGNIHDQLAVRNVGRRLFGGGTHKDGGHRKQQQVLVHAQLRQVGGVVHGFGQFHAGQVGVTARGAQIFQFLRQGAPHGDVLAVDHQHTCQRNAPGSCTQYSHFSHSLFPPSDRAFCASG